jgi:hypothetical protein
MSTATEIKWTRVTAGLYHGEVAGLDLAYTVWRDCGIWYAYEGKLTADEANVTNHETFADTMREAKEAMQRKADANTPDERFPVGKLVWDTKGKAYARVVRMTPARSIAVLVKFLPGANHLPEGNCWLMKDEAAPQVENESMPAIAPEGENVSQGAPYGFATVEIDRPRTLLPGITVTALQAVGRTVTYRATTNRPEGIAWTSYIASHRNRGRSVTVTGGHAVFSVTLAHEVRPAEQPGNMVADLELTDTTRVVEIVPADGIVWEARGNADQVAVWLGNCREVDRVAIRLAAKQVSGYPVPSALRISFPSVMTFFLGWDNGAYRISVPPTPAERIPSWDADLIPAF